MVRLVQVMFWEGEFLEEIAWVTMFLLLKWVGMYRYIVLVEMLRKVCSVVVDLRLKVSFVLHDSLHGFRDRRETGIATLEANLYKKLEGHTRKSLFQVFLDVRNAYDSLDG